MSRFFTLLPDFHLLRRFFTQWLYAICNDIPFFILLYVYALVPLTFEQMVPWRGFLYLVFLQPLPIICVMIGIGAISKCIRRIILVCCTFVFFVELCCFFSQHTRIGSAVLILMMQTSPNEATGYLSTILPNIAYATLCLCGILLFFLVLNKWYAKHKIGKWLMKCRSRRLFIGISLVLLSCFTVYKTTILLHNNYKYYYQRIWNAQLVCAPINYGYSLYDAIQENNHINLNDLFKETKRATVKIQSNEALTIVYIIGESHIKHRSGYYGYRLNTTPFLDKLVDSGNLITLTDVITHSSQTKDVLCEMLSPRVVDEDTPYDKVPMFPALMKKAKFKVYYFDNQSVPVGRKFDFGCNFFMSKKSFLICVSILSTRPPINMTEY